MRKANLIAGTVLLLFSLALLFWLIPMQIEETFGEEVSPRLLPQVCAAGIGLLSLLLIVTNFKAPAGWSDESDPFPISGPELRAMLVIAFLLGAGIWVFTVGGPVPACALVMLGIMLAMGERRILPLLLIPSTLLFASYLLFYQFLGTAIV